jgi:predicted Zn-dependent protease
MSLLDSIATENLKDTKPLKLYAKLQVQSKKFVQAGITAERGRKIDPNDPSWILLLSQIYTQTKQDDKLLEIAEEISRMDPDALAPRKRLATHYRDMGKHAEAEKYARMSLEIDANDGTCQRILVQALDALNRRAEADRLRKIFGL